MSSSSSIYASSPDVDVSLMNYALSAATTYVCGPSWHVSQDQHVIIKNEHTHCTLKKGMNKPNACECVSIIFKKITAVTKERHLWK